MKTYSHIKTGGKYKVIGKALVKDEKTRDWKKAVIYSAIVGEALERQVYVRTQKDFDERFVEMEKAIRCDFCSMLIPGELLAQHKKEDCKETTSEKKDQCLTEGCYRKKSEHSQGRCYQCMNAIREVFRRQGQ